MKPRPTLDHVKRQLIDYVHQAVSVLPPEATLELTGPSPDDPMLWDDRYGADPAGPQVVSAGFGIRGLDPEQYPHYFDLVTAHWKSHGWKIHTVDRRRPDDAFVAAKSPDKYGLALQSNPVGGLYIKGSSPAAMATPASEQDGQQRGRKRLAGTRAPQVPLRRYRPRDLTIDQARERLLGFVTDTASALPARARIERTGPVPDQPILCDDSEDADPAGPRYVSVGFEIHDLNPGDYPRYFDLVTARLQASGWHIQTDDPRPSGYRYLDAEHPDGYGLAFQSNSLGGLFIGGDTPCIPATT